LTYIYANINLKHHMSDSQQYPSDLIGIQCEEDIVVLNISFVLNKQHKKSPIPNLLISCFTIHSWFNLLLFNLQLFNLLSI